MRGCCGCKWGFGALLIWWFLMIFVKTFLRPKLSFFESRGGAFQYFRWLFIFKLPRLAFLLFLDQRTFYWSNPFTKIKLLPRALFTFGRSIPHFLLSWSLSLPKINPTQARDNKVTPSQKSRHKLTEPPTHSQPNSLILSYKLCN